MLAASSQSISTSQLAVLLILVGIIAVLRRQGMRDPAAQGLPRGQRVRPMLLQVIDPIATVFLAGPLLLHEIRIDGLHGGLAMVGLVIGVPIGLLRAGVSYVEAVPATKSVVLARTRLEVGILLVLVVVKLSEVRLESVTKAPLTLLLCIALGLAISESVIRTVAISLRYLTDTRRPTP